MNLATLRNLGFDNAKHVPFTKQYHVACSQCQALAINGTPTHEHGCPNAVKECHGCNALIPINQKYCQDCQ